MSQKTPRPSSYTARMRADLSGGTLDIWPLYLLIENCVTVQLSLNITAQVSLTPLENTSQINIKIKNPLENKTFTFSSLSDFLNTKNPELSLAQVFVKYFNPKFGFELRITSHSPIGGGLGGSSSIAVGLLKCFLKSMHMEMSFTDSIYLCRDLEAQVLKTPTGIQDYIIPLQSEDFSLKHSQTKHPQAKHPWINIVKLQPLKPKIKSLPAPPEILQNLILIYSGISHHSGQTNWQIIQNALNGNNIKLLEECRDISLEMSQSLDKNLSDLFEREFIVRKKIQELPQDIKKLREFLIHHGAQSMKFMGAGNGGCLLVWTEEKDKLCQACKEHNVQVLDKFND